MKYRFTFLTLLLFAVAFVSQAQQYTMGTYNLRYDNPRDTGNRWVNRAPVIASLVRFHRFDIFGTQEGLKNQLDDLSSALPEFSYYGRGRDDGKDKGEHSAIFFRKDKFALVQKGDFWLSETPEKPSLGWDATCCNRICSWVKLKDRHSGVAFYFFNVHYDHQGVKARQESSKLILQRIKDIAGINPVILTGDFNGGHESQWYKAVAESEILKDAYNEVQRPYANNGSFNAFGQNLASDEIIDHVFISSQFGVNRYGILTDSYHGKYPSDHFPVLVDVELKKQP